MYNNQIILKKNKIGKLILPHFEAYYEVQWLIDTI